MAGSTYRIKIVRQDFEFEAEGDKAFVQEMLARFEGGSPPADKKKPTPENQAVHDGSRPQITTDKPLSVGEYVRQLGIKKHKDLVLAFGYYLEKIVGVAEFTPADINSCYYDAKMENSNTSQMITRNIRVGLMMEAKKDKGAKGRKAFVLTRSGEEVIEKILSNGTNE